MTDDDEKTTTTQVVDDASTAGMNSATTTAAADKASTTTTQATATATAAVSGTVVYVGPNFSKDGLHMTTFSVFKGGLPEPVAAKASADSNFAAMFVPVSQLNKARADVDRRGCVLNLAYQAVLKAVRG